MINQLNRRSTTTRGNINIIHSPNPMPRLRPSGGNCLNIGARKVSIIAAVAVLDTNIENNPVMRRNPKSTFLFEIK